MTSSVFKIHELYDFRYSIAQKGANQGYIVDVKLKICLNLDGQEFCIPTNEIHFMNQVEIPVCQTRSLVDFRSKWNDIFTEKIHLVHM